MTLPLKELETIAQNLFEANVASVSELVPTGRSVVVRYQTVDCGTSGEWQVPFDVPMVACLLRRVRSYEDDERIHAPLVRQLNSFL